MASVLCLIFAAGRFAPRSVNFQLFRWGNKSPVQSPLPYSLPVVVRSVHVHRRFLSAFLPPATEPIPSWCWSRRNVWNVCLIFFSARFLIAGIEKLPRAHFRGINGGTEFINFPLTLIKGKIWENGEIRRNARQMKCECQLRGTTFSIVIGRPLMFRKSVCFLWKEILHTFSRNFHLFLSFHFFLLKILRDFLLIIFFTSSSNNFIRRVLIFPSKMF